MEKTVQPIIYGRCVAAVQALSEGSLHCVLCIDLMVLALNGFCRVLYVQYKLLGFEVWLAGAKIADV